MIRVNNIVRILLSKFTIILYVYYNMIVKMTIHQDIPKLKKKLMYIRDSEVVEIFDLIVKMLEDIQDQIDQPIS